MVLDTDSDDDDTTHSVPKQSGTYALTAAISSIAHNIIVFIILISKY
jgi:hypothetical protein